MEKEKEVKTTDMENVKKIRLPRKLKKKLKNEFGSNYDGSNQSTFDHMKRVYFYHN